MTDLDPTKLHVNYQSDFLPDAFQLPRRYTLTHSDATGDLFLTIGAEFNYHQISGLYTRLMRDEVLAEWIADSGDLSFCVYCHVSGGVLFGSAEWRYNIFRHHLPQVLESFREGDRQLFLDYPKLDKIPIKVYFKSTTTKFNRMEEWGNFEKYLTNIESSNIEQSQRTEI